MIPQPQADQADGVALALALDMMGRAFAALAMLYEQRHPGEYLRSNQQLKDLIADTFRHVEGAPTDGALGSLAFYEALLRVRAVLERVEAEISTVPSGEVGQIG
ncbi:hypothetical protein ACRAWG_37035 [Methylobacterium sp. P31]